MKRIAMMLVAGLISVSPVWAGSTVTVPMSASVNSLLELEATVFEGNIADGVIRNNMAFGQLVQDEPGGALRGSKFYNVLLSARTSSRRYKITQTANALTSGSNALAAGASIMTPHSNGATLPAGSTLSPRRSFVGANAPIYSSENAGSVFPVAVTYAIANDPANGATQFITENQPAGSYTSAVTFTLTVI